MSATCPACQASINWTKLKKVFTCPACGVELTAKTGTAWVATIVIWTILDIPIKTILYAQMGTDSMSSLVVRVLVDCVVGLSLASVIVGDYSKVSLKHEQ
jgi:uncharacterized protein (DUF983 family)